MENILEQQESIKKVQREVSHWHYPEFKFLTNEQIVKHIQETNDSHYWDELDKRTQELYSFILREKIHSYYRENMREDILTVLKLG